MAFVHLRPGRKFYCSLGKFSTTLTSATDFTLINKFSEQFAIAENKTKFSERDFASFLE